MNIPNGSLSLDWDARAGWQQRPDRRPVMYQSWQQLAFMHWRVPADWLAQRLPPFLTLDTWENAGWLGIVSFQMRNIRPAFLPPVPWISNFLELNVRTYVVDPDGRPGVWFFSLSANRWLAVALARSGFHLPYFWSEMSDRSSSDGWIDYHCRRYRQAKPATRHQFRYRPGTEFQPAPLKSLEFFLVERYLLFAENPKKPDAPYRGQVHHSPYQVGPLEVERCDSGILKLDGLLPEASCIGARCPGPNFLENPLPDHALFCRGVDVEVFGLET